MLVKAPGQDKRWNKIKGTLFVVRMVQKGLYYADPGWNSFGFPDSKFHTPLQNTLISFIRAF
jgi:hypothetical protein